jgi:hypothetical protein
MRLQALWRRRNPSGTGSKLMSTSRFEAAIGH